MRNVFIIFILILLFGCDTQSGNQKTQEKIRVTDLLGREIILRESAERVISTAPNITEIVYALDQEEKLVAVSSWCDYPPDVDETPRIGDFANPSLEKVVSHKPDLILATPQKETPTLDKFEQMGLTVVCVHPENFEEFLKSIAIIGEVLGCQHRADSLILDIRSDIAALNPVQDSLKVYVEIYANPLMTASGSSFVGDIIEMAGGKNIAADLPQAYPTINAEKIVAADPEIIITTYPNADIEQISNRLGWGNISAVKNHKIYVDIDPNILIRPAPRVVRGIKTLNQILVNAQQTESLE
jgi:iron complex transport system substrate-binding protein